MKIFSWQKYTVVHLILHIVSYSYNSGIYVLSFIYSLRGNNISDAGAQALAEGLQHCSNLQNLE